MKRGAGNAQGIGLEFDRSIPANLRALALSRVEFACFMCGAAVGDPDPYDPSRSISLRIAHVLGKEDGGLEELPNLRAICSVCNEGARNLTLDRPSLQKLLIQVRRATGADQVQVLSWLVRKFPKQAQKLLKENSSAS